MFYMVNIIFFALNAYFAYYFTSFIITPLVLKGFCCIIGLRGSGKSNCAAMLAWYWINIRHAIVYSNFPIRGCIEYDVSDLGVWNIHNVVLILDEAGIDLSNRKILEKSMKGIKEQNRKFWKLTRHYHIPNVFIFSQALDYDITLRRLCDSQWIITGGRFGSSLLHIVSQRWMPSQDGTDITIGLDILKFPHLRIHRKFWFIYYDSFITDPLPNKDFLPYRFDSLPVPYILRSTIHTPRQRMAIQKAYKKRKQKK